MRTISPIRWQILLIAVLVPCLCLAFVARGQSADGKSAEHQDQAAGTQVDFQRDVATVLVRNCLACHSGSEPSGGLNLTNQADLLRGGEAGAILIPGKPQDSKILARLREGSMPPAEKGKPLPEEQITKIESWIAAGAEWPQGRTLSPFEFSTDRRAGYDWWSLQSVTAPAVPAVHDENWVRSPIDRFVLSRLAQEGLSPNKEADKLTLLRRVTFDLIGLPPTPEEQDAFLLDDSPEAYEKVVDRLLDSPHYGEHWGRHWLDVVRFGESDGFENDRLREHAWRYRDYVIASLNADKPYDQFVREQIAGDVLTPVTREGIVATGYLVAGPWDEIQKVAASPVERARAHEEQIEELIASVSQTFLGVTLNCARCHDHKFDPFTQDDYYALKAILDGVDHGNRPVLTPDELTVRNAEIAQAQMELDKALASVGVLKSRGPGHARRIPLSAEINSPQASPGKYGSGIDGRIARGEGIHKPVYNLFPLTVECWGRLDGKSGFNILAASHPKESSEHWELYTFAGTGELSVLLPGFSPAEVKCGVDVCDGQWHHLAFSFDGKLLGIYVDGKRVKESTETRQRTAEVAGPLYIASYPPQSIGCEGVVDDLRLSRAVRDFVGVPESPLAADESTIGLWHFDQWDNETYLDEAKSTADDLPEDELRQALEVAQRSVDQARQARTQLDPELSYAAVVHEPGETVVYSRGNVEKPLHKVSPSVPRSVVGPVAEFVDGSSLPEGERRRRFADWLVDPRNPLTARVMVNRVWHYHFGRGIVETPSDLGFNGGRPSHEDLLNHLTVEFAKNGMRLKSLHRQILLSATYRQSSEPDPAAAEKDADNRLLWRYPPRRLEAESVRDAMLHVSGQLNPTMGGASFKPFKVTSLLTFFYEPFDSAEPAYNRRTIYRCNVNTGKSPFLEAMDCPAPSVAAPQRRVTTTPLQALALMNDSFVLRQAEQMAARVTKHVPGKIDAQIRAAYRLVMGRPPSDEEVNEGLAFIQSEDLASFCWVLLNSSEFLYVR